MSISVNFAQPTPSMEWLAGFLDDIPGPVALFDAELRYVAANPAWRGVFGLGEDIIGQVHFAQDGPNGEQFAECQRRALSGEGVDYWGEFGTEAGSRQHRQISFRPRRASNGAVVGVLATLRDGALSEPLDPAEQGADGLTGIADRKAFLARVRSVLTPSSAPGDGAALFLLDIDDFKGINDLYGSRVGDCVLATIAARLLTGIRSRAAHPARSDRPAAPDRADLAARLGADEFGVVLGNAAPNATDADAFARRLLNLVSAPIVVGDQRIRLSANVGYLITGPGHRSEDDVLRDLNVAVQEAKLRGPNSAKAWDPALTSLVGRRLALLDELRRALDEGEFVVHYQPILSLPDRRIVGAEALLRWNNPREGLVAPGAFLPLLEESGLIVPVGGWLIREVVHQMQVWQALYGRDILDWVSINVSARQFNDPSLLLAVLGEVADSGFPLDKLKLEITESAVMRNPEITRAVLAKMHDIGIRVGLDDFGTGYSALGALRHYNVDMIKIDRDFTARLDTRDGRELVLALLKIARIYGASVVAEGVETVAQRDMLHASGCDFGQGYLFAKPMDGGIFGAFALTQLVNEVADARSA